MMKNKKDFPAFPLEFAGIFVSNGSILESFISKTRISGQIALFRSVNYY